MCTLSHVSQEAPAITGMVMDKIPPLSQLAALYQGWKGSGGDKTQVTSLCHAGACCSFLQPPGEGGRAADPSPASRNFLILPRPSAPENAHLPCPGMCAFGLGMHSCCVQGFVIVVPRNALLLCSGMCTLYPWMRFVVPRDAGLPRSGRHSSCP